MPFRDRPGDYLAFVGRITPEKGIGDAIELSRATGIRLQGRGQGPPRVRARGTSARSCSRRSTTDVIDFLGEVGPEERDPLYAGALATVMLGAWPEPFGLVAIESMATGTPVIARRAGALIETVIHGENGFIVDDVDEAVLAVERVGELDRTKIRERRARAVLAGADGRRVRGGLPRGPGRRAVQPVGRRDDDGADRTAGEVDGLDARRSTRGSTTRRTSIARPPSANRSRVPEAKSPSATRARPRASRAAPPGPHHPADDLGPTHDPGPDAARARLDDERVEAAASEPLELTGGPQVRIGTASWTDPTMTAAGRVLPDRTPTPPRSGSATTRRGSRSSRSTRPTTRCPSRRLSELWVERTPPDFVFDIKAHALLTGQPTETKRLPKGAARGAARRRSPRSRGSTPRTCRASSWPRSGASFADGLEPLAESGQLGAVFLQYPKWFFTSSENRDAIREAKAALAPHGLTGRGRVPQRLVVQREEHRADAAVPRGRAGPAGHGRRPAGVQVVACRRSSPTTSPDLAVVRFHGRRTATWESMGGRRPSSASATCTTRRARASGCRGSCEAAGQAQDTHVLMNNCYANYGSTNARELAAMLAEELAAAARRPDAAARRAAYRTTVAAAAAPGFLPSLYGLRFANSFPPGPTVRFGPFDTRFLGFGDAAAGLCGGMALTARDLYEAKVPAPPDTNPPANGSPRFDALVRRQVQSLDWFKVPLHFLDLQALRGDPPTGIAATLGREPARVDAVLKEWPRHPRRRSTAATRRSWGSSGRPSSSPAALTQNHQVLAYAYEETPEHDRHPRLRPEPPQQRRRAARWSTSSTPRSGPGVIGSG